jgi:hypothetical protein
MKCTSGLTLVGRTGSPPFAILQRDRVFRKTAARKGLVAGHRVEK